jgi:hypothetical protein
MSIKIPFLRSDEFPPLALNLVFYPMRNYIFGREAMSITRKLMPEERVATRNPAATVKKR